MKTLKLFFVLILPIAFFSCNKEENGHINVDRYVKLLKTNKYNNARLPEFILEDIDELLKYRNEKDLITNYPRNNLSSAFQVEVELGIYILWTIEAIRLSSITGLTGFPSLEPAFIPRNAEDYDAEKQQEARQEASNAYYNWWRMRGITEANFDSWLNIDPLGDTKYKWY